MKPTEPPAKFLTEINDQQDVDHRINKLVDDNFWALAGEEDGDHVVDILDLLRSAFPGFSWQAEHGWASGRITGRRAVDNLNIHVAFNDGPTTWAQYGVFYTKDGWLSQANCVAMGSFDPKDPEECVGSALRESVLKEVTRDGSGPEDGRRAWIAYIKGIEREEAEARRVND